MKATLLGGPGWGKSTVLEVLSRRFPDQLIVEGDALLQFAFMLKEKAPMQARVDCAAECGNVFEWMCPHGVLNVKNRRELDSLLEKGHWLDRVDLTTNFRSLMKDAFLVVPDHAMYERQLRARTKAMLKEKVWAGHTADEWPVLSFPEFQGMVQDIWDKADVTAAIPNLGPSCDRLWIQWWDHYTRVHKG
jgi:hypothetical protein